MTQPKYMMLCTEQIPQMESVPPHEIFRLIPIRPDSPYVECRFRFFSKELMLISSTKFETFQMLSKLNENGEVIIVQPTKTEAKDGKKPIKKMERKAITSFYDYTLTKKEDIIDFVSELTGSSPGEIGQKLEHFFIPYEAPPAPPTELPKEGLSIVKDEKDGKTKG